MKGIIHRLVEHGDIKITNTLTSSMEICMVQRSAKAHRDGKATLMVSISHCKDRLELFTCVDSGSEICIILYKA